MSKKILSIILLCCIVIFALSSRTYVPRAEEIDLEDDSTDVINVWYTDEALDGYMKEAASAFQQQTGISVALTLTSGLEYLENIQEATLHGENGPDAYIISSDSLEKARLSGLAAEMQDGKGVLNATHFPQVALNAVTYNDKILGYPFTYETAGFFYNDSYLTEIAEKAIASEAEQNPGMIQDVEAKKQEIFPVSMVGLLEFANTYEPPETMETFLLWDVTDVMYNYGFAGAYMNVGGITGDNREEIDIYNTDAMYCLSVYQDFNQFFSIDAEAVDANRVKEDFISGKIMYTIGGTNMMMALEEAKTEGTFTWEYDVASIEMLNANLAFKPLSVTSAVAVNDYSEKQDAAELFARFIACDYASNLYVRSGKLCAYALEEYPVPAMEKLRTCYENSVSLPKIVENSNYWILAELCYTNIWDGGDVNTELMNLSSQVKKEISGTEVSETKLETPVVTESYIQSE